MRAPIKCALALALTGMAAGSAMAADGTISFTGEIISASCVATTPGGGNSAGANNAISVPLGQVGLNSLGTTVGANVAAAKNIDITLDCDAGGATLNNVIVRFDPHGGSGLAPGGLLKLTAETGVAQGVAIALYNGNTRLDLASNDSLTAPLRTEGGKLKADLTLRAGYVSTQATPVVGKANATLPFSLTYN